MSNLKLVSAAEYELACEYLALTNMLDTIGKELLGMPLVTRRAGLGRDRDLMNVCDIIEKDQDDIFLV